MVAMAMEFGGHRPPTPTAQKRRKSLFTTMAAASQGSGPGLRKRGGGLSGPLSLFAAAKERLLGTTRLGPSPRDLWGRFSLP